MSPKTEKIIRRGAYWIKLQVPDPDPVPVRGRECISMLYAYIYIRVASFEKYIHVFFVWERFMFLKIKKNKKTFLACPQIRDNRQKIMVCLT